MFKILVAVLLMALLTSYSIAALALTDPTRPQGFQQQASKQTLKLESVLIGESRKVAVINGKVVAEGDMVSDAKVLRINKQSVQLSRGGVTSTLALKHTSIRQEK